MIGDDRPLSQRIHPIVYLLIPVCVIIIILFYEDALIYITMGFLFLFAILLLDVLLLNFVFSDFLFHYRWDEYKRAKTKAFEREQRAKGLVEFKDKWGTPEQVKRWREIDIGLENNFADYSPYEFEEFIAKLFRKMGYTAETTSRVKDFGADIIAKKDDETVAIQVKKNAVGNNVGAPVIQQTLGSMWRFKAGKSIVITTSDFTVQAEEQAKGAPVELWNRKILERMVRKYFIDIEAE